MAAGAGLIGPALSLAGSASSKGGGSSGSSAPVMTENPAAVSNMIGNQFATSGTFNSPMRVDAQVQGANQAAAGNATANAQLAAAQGNQLASLQSGQGFSQGFNTPTGGSTSSSDELGTTTGDPVLS